MFAGVVGCKGGQLRKLVWVIPIVLASTVSARAVRAQEPQSTVELGIGAARTHLSGDDVRTQEGLGSLQVTVGARFLHHSFRISYRQTDRDIVILRRVTGGWFIEFGRRSWRPFLEPGWTLSTQSSGPVASRTLTGPHLSAGLTVDLTGPLFIRPEVSADLQVRGPMLLREAGLTVGLKF